MWTILLLFFWFSISSLCRFLLIEFWKKWEKVSFLMSFRICVCVCVFYVNLNLFVTRSKMHDKAG